MKKLILVLSCFIALALTAACGPQEPPRIPVSGIVLDKVKATLTEGETMTLVPTVRPFDASDKTVRWSSSNQAVATVTDGGVVRALHAGTAVIMATTNDGGYPATCTVTVATASIAVTGVALDRVKVTMTEGETTTLVPTVTPADATDKSVCWSSSNQAVATVTDGGVVRALHAGTTVITATTNDGGITATCTVIVDIAMAAITGETSHISCRNAKISGKANLPETTAADLTFGVLYSTNSGVLLGTAKQILAKSFDSDYNFTVNTDVLEPETTYYYRSYIIQNNEVIYGDTESFKTLAVSSMIRTLEATEVEAGFATLNAALDLTDCQYDAVECGFKLTPQGGSESLLKVTDLSDKAFSYKAGTLVSNKQYSVTAYVELDGRTYRAETKTFTTQPIKASVTLNEATDITELKATISGLLAVESQGSFSKSAILYYSPTETAQGSLIANGQRINLALNEADGSFSKTLINLNPSTTYCYVVIATVDGVAFASEVKSFTTANYSVVVMAEEATDITGTRAKLNGKLAVNSIENPKNLSKSVWFYYSSAASDVAALKTEGTQVTSTLALSSDGTFWKALYSLSYNTTYYYIACATVNGNEFTSEVKSFTTKPHEPAAVDLGLSVKWASFNIGASKEEEFGDYFAWGETETKSYYSWSTYKFGTSYNGPFSKYNTSSSYGPVDNKTVLDPEDDVAHVKLGGNWRMPTEAEWNELLNRCTWTWTTINGVNGYLVTRKTTPKVSIFLPASFASNGEGDYWSSSASSPSGGKYVTFDKSHVYISSSYRYSGKSVRPVSD